MIGRWLTVAVIPFLGMSGPVNAQACYRDMIRQPAPFMGNHGEIFTLGSGDIWQVQFSYEYLYEYYPTVIVCPSQGFIALKDKKIDIVYVGKLQRSVPQR